MKNKLFGLLALLVVASLVLAACGPTATPSEEPAGEEPAAEEPPAEEPAAEEPAEEAAPVTVTLWHSLKDSETAGLNEIINAYTAENPNVTIETLFVPFDDLRNKYETAAATGEGPDILIGADDWGPALYDALLVADLSDVPTDNVNAAALAVGQYNDAQVELPYVLKGVVLFRNTAIQPEPAASWDDLKAKAQAATSGDTYGALLEIGNFFSFAHLYGQGGALMNADGTPAFNTEAGAAWLAMLADFKALGADSWYSDNDINLFKEGKVGWVIDGTWNLAGFSEALGDNLAIDPWPAGMSGFVQTGAIMLSANAEGDAALVAKGFIGYLLTSEAQAAFYASDDAFIPSNTTVAVDDPLRAQALAAFGGGTAWIVTPAMGSYWGPTETLIKTVIDEGTDITEALNTAEQAVLDSLSQ
ncbi:MAG: extracellular solute-binding protein [Chloroflexi bacterium]|nr:extracellular solute-binding protein [Chloroflexota bacterium]